MLLKPFDFGILIPAFGAVLASFFLVYSGADTQRTIYLQGDGGEWVFSPDAVETVTVAGPLGDTVVAIQGGQIRVLSSPCANQTCVAAGAIHAPGQWAACLPNRVMVFVLGESPPRPAAGRFQNGGANVDATAW
jgi:hypothetical protein